MSYLTTTFNLVLMILGFGLLIFVHELGHFLAAKWAGIRTEAFAVGMGTPISSWRKGIGWCWGSTIRKVVAMTGKNPSDLTDEELARAGIGETEYSLRWLPIGGFVKMLGQDDLDPTAVSQRPRSYNTCPVPRRMVVISAGVIANIILAIVLFVVAFMIGVRSEQPVVGPVTPGSPASGVLQPGDRILRIDDHRIETFADVEINVAMAKPEVPLHIVLERGGAPDTVAVDVTPVKSDETGLLGIGIGRGRSTRLFDDDRHGTFAAGLERAGLAQLGIRPGLEMISAAGTPVSSYQEFADIVDRSGGRPVPSRWRDDGGSEHSIDIPVMPVLQSGLVHPQVPAGVDQNADDGLLGLLPLVEISLVEGLNDGRLEPGDVVLRAGSVDGPGMVTLKSALKEHAGRTIDLIVLRDGEEVPVEAEVDKNGRLNVGIGYAMDLPIMAAPMTSLRRGGAVEATPFHEARLMGRTRMDHVGGTPVTDWATLRAALRDATAQAYAAGSGATVVLGVRHPTPDEPAEDIEIELSPDDVRMLHELGWTSPLDGRLFEPLVKTLSAGGNPIRAVTMGFEQTWKFLVMTYLTIDRLVRGSVGVEQIRGPVGIVHIGAQVADRGFTYLIFFLGIISVNLAVINFLPLPIVDGGLFLFLIYEKLKGRPPSLAFQNAATILGIAMIATVLLFVTWNDVVRLVSGAA